MTETKREAGSISIEDTLGNLLACMREMEGAGGSAELYVDEVRDVERGLGWRLPDDILAVFSAGISFLEEKKSMQLARVIGHTGRVRSLGATGDIVGIGKEEEDVFICVEKGMDGDGTRLLIYDAEKESRNRVSLIEWLEDICRSRHGDKFDLEKEKIKDPGTADNSGRAHITGIKFMPKLVRRLPEGSPGYDVHHNVFGPGRVIKETGRGPYRKVQVDFPGKGIKLLDARYLEWIE